MLIGLLDIKKMLMGLIYLRKLKGPENDKSTLGEREWGSVVERVGPSNGGDEKESGPP